MIPVQQTRKSKHTDQFNENFTYNLDSFAQKRDTHALIAPKPVETVNEYFQYQTEQESARLNQHKYQHGTNNFKRKTKYNAYANAQFNNGVYIHPGWDKL